MALLAVLRPGHQGPPFGLFGFGEELFKLLVPKIFREIF